MTLIIDAFTAYLGPLLKKHDAGKYVSWEDLVSSYAASKEVLKSKDNFFVSKRIEQVHKSQIQAYREAALKALREWAKSSAVPLEPMEENDTEDSFVERCVKAVAKLEQPDWKIDNGKAVVAAEIRKRAKAIYAKYHPGDDDAEEGEEEESGGEEEESGEEGEEEEDAEEEEDGEMEEEQTAKPTKQQANKAKKQQKGAKNTKKQAHKKGTTAKQGTANTRVQAARKGPGGNRSRRGGRGGKSKGN